MTKTISFATPAMVMRFYTFFKQDVSISITEYGGIKYQDNKVKS